MHGCLSMYLSDTALEVRLPWASETIAMSVIAAVIDCFQTYGPKSNSYNTTLAVTTILLCGEPSDQSFFRNCALNQSQLKKTPMMTNEIFFIHYVMSLWQRRVIGISCKTRYNNLLSIVTRFHTSSVIIMFFIARAKPQTNTTASQERTDTTLLLWGKVIRNKQIIQVFECVISDMTQFDFRPYYNIIPRKDFLSKLQWPLHSNFVSLSRWVHVDKFVSN